MRKEATGAETTTPRYGLVRTAECLPQQECGAQIAWRTFFRKRKLHVNTVRRPYRNKRRGVLTFEWILLITVLVIGIVGGVSAVRDAVISELGDVAGAAIAVDQSYSVTSVTLEGESQPLGTEFGFDDPDAAFAEDRKDDSPTDRQTVGVCGNGEEQ
jgi:hypothetical protein